MFLLAELYFVVSSRIFQCLICDIQGLFTNYNNQRDCFQINLVIFYAPNPNPQKLDFGPNSDHVMIWSHVGLKNRLMFLAGNYTFLESLGPGLYNKTIFKMFYNCFKDFCNQCEYRELLRRIILHVTCSEFIKEPSISVTSMNIEML